MSVPNIQDEGEPDPVQIENRVFPQFVWGEQKRTKNTNVGASTVRVGIGLEDQLWCSVSLIHMTSFPYDPQKHRAFGSAVAVGEMV